MLFILSAAGRHFHALEDLREHFRGQKCAALMRMRHGLEWISRIPALRYVVNPRRCEGVCLCCYVQFFDLFEGNNEGLSTGTWSSCS